MFKKIDNAQLETIIGGAQQSRTGGCTGPTCPRPFPRPFPFPGGEPPFQIPETNRPPV